MPVKTKSRLDNMGVPGGLVDARAKQVLKEAVDAVVNSFAKHTQGYGRGNNLIFVQCILYSIQIKNICHYDFSERRRSLAGFLADETKSRHRIKKRSTRDLRISARIQPSIYLLCYFTRRIVLWKFSELSN